MFRTLLQLLGATALLAWGGLGLWAWTLVGAGLNVTVSHDDARTPAAADTLLLRDSVHQLEGDVHALADAVRGLRSPPAAGTATGLTLTVGGAVRDRTTPASGFGSQRPESAPVPAAAAHPAEKPASSSSPGFLSFRLPSEGFEFDAEQRFAVLPDLSRIGFDAKTTLRDFSAVTSAVRGELCANLARPGALCRGSLAVDTRQAGSGDDAAFARIGTPLHPLLVLAIDGLDEPAVERAAMRLRGTLRGRLQVRGVEQPVAMPVHLHVDDARRLVIEGEVHVKLSDFGVEAPSAMGVISMQDEIVVWLSLRARSSGRIRPEVAHAPR